MQDEHIFSPGALGQGGESARWASLAADRLSRYIWLIPCALAAAYLTVFVANLPHHLWEMSWNSDFASGFTVPEAVFKTGTGNSTVLGPYALYVPLWFGLLTAGLPLHRQLWEIAPTLSFVLSALIVGWSVHMLATRRAAVLAVLLVIIASPAALSVFMSSLAHNTVYPGTALLGAYLVWLVRVERRRRVATFAVALVAAATLGAFLASDILLVSTGVAPLTAAALVALVRRERRSRLVGLTALATVALAVPFAILTSTIMGSVGYRTNAPTLAIGWVPHGRLSLHADMLLEGLRRLFNGYLAGAPASLRSVLAPACELAMVLALVTLLFAGARALVASILTNRPSRGTTVGATATATALHTVFWVSSAIVACAAYVLTDFMDGRHEAFYATVILAVAAVLPLLLRRSAIARWLLPVGASAFFAASLVGQFGHPIWGVPPLAHYQSELVKMARSYDATSGYSGYWQASSLTWSSDNRVTARPVFACPNPGGADLCIYPQETVPAWYAPHPGRSFLLIESTEELLNTLPRGLGEPLATYSFGPEQLYKVYFYPYNIASRLGPS